MSQQKLISKSIQLPADVWEFIADLASAEERSTSYVIRHIIGEFIRNDFDTRILPRIQKRFGYGHDADTMAACFDGDTALHLWAIVDDIRDEYTQAEDEEKATLRIAGLFEKDEELREKAFAIFSENVRSKEPISSVLRMYDKPFFKGTGETKLTNGRG